MQAQTTNMPTNIEKKSKTVAVVTSTIGRPQLEKAILSVQAQTYPCVHYVFVDGEKYHDDARKILEKYPHVKVTYLPVNTGGGGWTNSFINPIASFLVREDVICFLDDDNTYQPNHVETIMAEFNHQDIDYAYSLRRLVNGDRFICNDDYLSLGKHLHKLPNHIKLDWNIQGKKLTLNTTTIMVNLIDTNTMALSKMMAQHVAFLWTVKKSNDKTVTSYLIQKAKGVGTGRYTVNYQMNYHEPGFQAFRDQLEPIFGKIPLDNLLEQQMTLLGELNIKAYEGKPWAKE